MAKSLPKWARVRQLIDGSYVAEVRCGIWPFRSWKAVSRNGILSLKSDNIAHCIVEDPGNAITALANCGVSLIDDGKPEPTQEIVAAPEPEDIAWNGAAFITGSHCYGTPTFSSDIDLAILCSPDVEKKLKDMSDDKCFPIRFGKLNVITLKSRNEYAAWLAARNRLIAMPSHTKETRVEVHKQELAKRNCAHRKDVSS